MPEVRQKLLGQGAVAVGGSQAESAALIAADRNRYARIIVDNHLSAD